MESRNAPRPEGRVTEAVPRIRRKDTQGIRAGRDLQARQTACRPYRCPRRPRRRSPTWTLGTAPFSPVTRRHFPALWEPLREGQLLPAICCPMDHVTKTRPTRAENKSPPFKKLSCYLQWVCTHGDRPRRTVSKNAAGRVSEKKRHTPDNRILNRV